MRFGALVFVLMLVACGGDAGTAAEQTGCEQTPQVVSREVPGSNGQGVLKVAATRGCASLDVPIAAMNWFSVSDANALAAYNEVVSVEVFKIGARVLVVGKDVTALDVPQGLNPNGGPFVQEELAIPLYPSADAFLGMITSPEFMAAPPKEDGVKDNYEFSFQECLANCNIEDTQLPTEVTGTIVLQHLLVDRGAVVHWLPKLQGVVYAGYQLASLRLALGDEEGPAMDWMEPAWADATIVYQVADAAAADALLASEAFTGLASQASQQAVLRLKPAL